MTEEIQVADTAAPETKNNYDGANIRGDRQETPEPDKAAKPSGYEPVNLDGLPPEVAGPIRERLDYMYRQVKDGTRTLSEYRRVAGEQSRQIDELTKGFNGVVTHLQDKNLEDSEDNLTRQMDAAFQKGDHTGYLDAQKKLINLGVEKRLLAEKKVQQPKAPQSVAATDAANRAAASGELTPEEYRATELWQSEKDENGNLLRPWAQTADMNNPDPLFSQALTEAKAVFANTRMAGLSYEEKLAEVDRRMGMQKRTVGQTVSGGGLTGRTKNQKLTLSPDIEKMVRVTKWGGSKYKTDDDRLDAYRKQLSTVRSNTKGAR